MSKPTKCIYCGAAEATTRDHIPPKSLYGKPRPSGLITVPSCEDCNRGFSLDDEYFRTVLALKEKAGDHPDAQFASKVAIRALRKPRKRGFAQAILGTTRTVRLRSHGGLDLGIGATYSVELARLGRVVSRITRALYWHHAHERILAKCGVETFFEDGLAHLTQDERRDLQIRIIAPLLAAHVHETPRNVLRYWYQLAAGEEPASAWLYEFYGNVRCLSLVVPETATGPRP